jgi:hypothetical protein
VLPATFSSEHRISHRCYSRAVVKGKVGNNGEAITRACLGGLWDSQFEGARYASKTTIDLHVKKDKRISKVHC